MIYHDYHKDGGYEKTVDGHGRRSFVLIDKNGFQKELAYILFFGSKNPVVQLDTYVKNVDEKRDKYGNLTYQVANRVEVVDITKGKANDVGIYERKVIEYEYY